MPCLPGSGIHRLPSGKFNLPKRVQRYCDDKRVKYHQQSDLPESEWPPPLGGTYIRLALIKQGRSMYDHRYELVIEKQIDYTRGDYDIIMERKTKIELKEALSRVFCKGGTEQQLRMLIDGAPGVGKTTLSRKVSKMWALGEILDRFWLILLLHLRESAVSKAKSIDEFFYHEDSGVQRSVAKFVKEKSGDGVLIIFDGFDELSAYERSEQSLFLDVIKGKILPKCAVVVTSRPYASRSIQELSQINRHIEVLGFTDDQVKKCIKQKITDQDKAEKLCTELKDRLDVASICQVPLNCSIVLYVYEQENYCLPRTLTELYDLFILHSLKRFVTRTQNDRAASRLLGLMNLESPYRVCFQSLCNLAVKGLEDDKLVFSRDDVEKCFPSWYHRSDSNPPVLDLMTSAKSYSSRGTHDTYSFLHLTIQEFLAAYHIAHHSSDADMFKFFRKNLLNDRFRMVLLFLSGMTNLEFHNAASIFSQESWNEDPVLICHLTYEAENHFLCDVISEICCNLRKKIELTGSRFDQLVMSDFVVSSDRHWAKFICNLEHIPVVHRVFSSKSLSCTTFIEKVEVACRSDEADDFSLLEHLEILSQFNKVSVVVELLGGDKRLANESLIENLGKFLTKTRLVWNKQYSLVLKGDNEFNSLTLVDARRQFCNMLSECLDQNNSLMEVTLNDVLPRDIEYVLKCFGRKINSVSCLKRLVCRSLPKDREALRVDELDLMIIPYTTSYSHTFCATLVSFCSRNTSLLEVVLELNHDYGIVRDNVDNIMSALANNSTLQKLTIYKRNSIVFQRNPVSKQMELTDLKWDNMSPVFNPISVYESSNTRNSLSSLLPAKQSCERSEMFLQSIEDLRPSPDNSGTYHCSPARPSRFAYSSIPSIPHYGSATEPSKSSPFSGSIPFASEQYTMNPSGYSSFKSPPSSYQCSSAIPPFQYQTSSISPHLRQTSTITGSNSIQPDCSFQNSPPSHNRGSCQPLVQPVTLSLTSQPPSCHPIQVGTSPFSLQPRKSARHCDNIIDLTYSDSDPHLNSHFTLSPNVLHQSERPAYDVAQDSSPPQNISNHSSAVHPIVLPPANPGIHSFVPSSCIQSPRSLHQQQSSMPFSSEHQLLASYGQHSVPDKAVNALPSPGQQQLHRVMSGGHSQILQHQSDMQHDISMPCNSSSLTCMPHSGSEALTGQQHINRNIAHRQYSDVQPPSPPQFRNSQTTWLPQTVQRQSSATPRAPPCFPSQRRSVHHSAPQQFPSIPLGVPHSISPQLRMYLQQSIAGAPSTTCSALSLSTHGSASHRGQHNVPSNNIANVEVSSLPLPSQHLSQGASHNQPYQQQTIAPLLLSPSGSGTLTGQQHFSQTVRHQHPRVQFTYSRLSTPIAQLPQVAHQQSFATPHVPPCIHYQSRAAPHSTIRGFFSTLV